MQISPFRSLCIILIMSVVTFLTRVIPFAVFNKGREIPKVIKYLGKVLPPAVIGMLIIYCFKSVNVFASPFGIPELIAGAVVVVLHVFKRNNLLSIGAGTVCYMLIVQVVLK